MPPENPSHDPGRADPAALAPSARFLSVDALRACVIGLMVFVNYVAGMKGAPAWSQHLPDHVDGYTLTDLVFPWFLFLAGVSIPLSLARRVGAPRGSGAWGSALGRVVPRAAALLLLGVITVNHDELGPATGIGTHLWYALALTAAFILWRVSPPDGSARRRRVELGLRIGALVGLAALLVAFRGEDGSRIEPRWWGILGLIGWTYLVAALIYLGARGRDVALMGMIGLLMCVSIGTTAGRYGPFAPLQHVFRVHEILGSLTAIVVAGAVAGGWLLGPEQGRIRRLLLFGLALWAAGWFLRPLHGYHKNAATEAWALVAAGQGALLLAAFHLSIDRRSGPVARPLARWLGLAGANAILAYLLPDWLGAVSGLAGVDLFPTWDRGGRVGLANAALLTSVVIALTALASRLRVTMKL